MSARHRQEKMSACLKPPLGWPRNREGETGPPLTCAEHLTAVQMDDGSHKDGAGHWQMASSRFRKGETAREIKPLLSESSRKQETSRLGCLRKKTGINSTPWWPQCQCPTPLVILVVSKGPDFRPGCSCLLSETAHAACPPVSLLCLCFFSLLKQDEALLKCRVT